MLYYSNKYKYIIIIRRGYGGNKKQNKAKEKTSSFLKTKKQMCVVIYCRGVPPRPAPKF